MKGRERLVTKKDVQDYLEKGMFGTPQLKPDEQRKYLGTFRERVYLSMTIAEMRNKKNLRHLKTELTQNPNNQLLINAAVGMTIQSDYMKVAQEAGCQFKIVDTDHKADNQSIGLVYAGETAVNLEAISVTDKYGSQAKKNTSEKNNEEKIEKKKGFFEQLFK